MSGGDGDHSSRKPSGPIPEATTEDNAAVDSSVARTAAEDTVAYCQKEKSGPAEKSAEQTLPKAFGRYEVRALLGVGRFGTVYIGYDNQLHREVAIKVPNLRLSSAEVEQDFLQEARRL